MEMNLLKLYSNLKVLITKLRVYVIYNKTYIYLIRFRKVSVNMYNEKVILKLKILFSNDSNGGNKLFIKNTYIII